MGGSVDFAGYWRVYSAAARMVWTQGDGRWRQSRAWPEEWSRAWRELAEALSTGVSVSSGRDAPSHPAHHLLSRRTDDGRPIPLPYAAREWRHRMSEVWAVRAPFRSETPLPPHELASSEVLLLDDRLLWRATFIVRELDHRLLPGRPECVIGPEAQPLARVVHEVADLLRAPFTGQETTPHPGGAGWIAAEPHPRTGVPAELSERLRRSARRAAEVIPADPGQTRGTGVDPKVCGAAAALLRVLDDAAEPSWHEPHTGVDPTRHLVHDPQVTAFGNEAEKWQRQLALGPEPWTPRESEWMPEPEEGKRRLAVLSKEVALLLAEVLDEIAARLHPGRRTGPVLFDAYPMGEFSRIFYGYLSGF